MPAEDQTLQLTIAFAPFDIVLPAVVGLFRAKQGYSRQVDNCVERQLARLDRLEKERVSGAPPKAVESVRVLSPASNPDVTIIEDFMCADHTQLAALLPDVNFLHLYSEYCTKNAERHSYAWRSNGQVQRQVYFHHNYQFPGWNWEEEGDPQPWEDVTRLQKKRVSARCDRALMLDYAERLGCELHGPLANNAWKQAILVYPIEETDASDFPAPTKLGEDFRKRSVVLGFGQGEEDISFDGHIADAHYFGCIDVHYAQVSDAIRNASNATELHNALKHRDVAPDYQDEYCRDLQIFEEALERAYVRFSDAPELKLIEDLAKSETRNHRFPLSDLRLRNIKARALGKPLEDDPDMFEKIFRGTSFAS